MIDYEATMSAIGNDRGLLEILIGMFLEDYPGVLAELQAASALGNSQEVYSAAHRLKGLVGNFHANTAMEELARIETSARGSNAIPSAETLARILQLCELTAEELKRYLPTT